MRNKVNKLLCKCPIFYPIASFNRESYLAMQLGPGKFPGTWLCLWEILKGRSRYMTVPLGDLEGTVPGTWLYLWEILNAPSRVHDYASGRSWMDRHIQSRVPRTSGWLLPRRIRAGGHDGLRDFRQVGGCQWSLARVHWKCPSRHPRELWGFRGRRQGGCPAGGAGWAERGNRELRHAWSNGNEGAITISFCGNPSNRENPPQSGWSFVWLHEEESGGGGGGDIEEVVPLAGLGMFDERVEIIVIFQSLDKTSIWKWNTLQVRSNISGANESRTGTSRVETREELRQHLARLKHHFSGGRRMEFGSYWAPAAGPWWQRRTASSWKQLRLQT